MLRPLLKKTKTGKAYMRPVRITQLLLELEALPFEELVRRAKIHNFKDPDYIPSECLLYFVRGTHGETSSAHFEALYKLLLRRVYRALPKAEAADGQTVEVTTVNSMTLEGARDKFVELICQDRHSYCERLDFFEIQFDTGIDRLRRDARRRAVRQVKSSRPLVSDAETNDMPADVERALGSYDRLLEHEVEVRDFQARLDAAIETLPEVQRKILTMLREGIPIDSKMPGQISIARTLGKSEKTVRNQRNEARKTLRVLLFPEEQA